MADRAGVLYERLRKDGNIFTVAVFGDNPFVGEHMDSLALKELDRLAAADGYDVSFEPVDDVGYDLTLVPRTPPNYALPWLGNSCLRWPLPLTPETSSRTFDVEVPFEAVLEIASASFAGEEIVVR